MLEHVIMILNFITMCPVSRLNHCTKRSVTLEASLYAPGARRLLTLELTAAFPPTGAVAASVTLVLTDHTYKKK